MRSSRHSGFARDSRSFGLDGGLCLLKASKALELLRDRSPKAYGAVADQCL